ncbi:MAG: hypothetical protein M0R46_13410 [Candidatus Muirbacterium halophilum]|nr:hypothetical protein [Candidatus Muirbacterium halophilum]MCK9476919.1 hypothetical protein [Candidatus Muirbacterium halophilum]
MWDIFFKYKKNLKCQLFSEKERFYFQFNQKNNLIVYVNKTVRFILTFNNNLKKAKIYFNDKNIDNDLLKYISSQYYYIWKNNPVLHCFSFIYNNTLFCIHGKSEQGKSTLGNFLINKLSNVILYSEDFLPINNLNAIFTGFFLKEKNKYIKNVDIINNNIINDFKFTNTVNIFLNEKQINKVIEVEKSKSLMIILNESHNMKFINININKLQFNKLEFINMQNLFDNIGEFVNKSKNISFLYKKDKESLNRILKYIKYE